jgi:type IV secretory pathway TrbL component
MTSHLTRAAALAAIGLATGVASHAESLASSASSAGLSASSAGSASSASLSDSSTSSSPARTTAAADGDYRVIDVAELADQPGMLQLTLRATTPGADRQLQFKLPRRAVEPRGIASGETVQVRNREYGLEFARSHGTAAREPFYLVLHDDWYHELPARPVSL